MSPATVHIIKYTYTYDEDGKKYFATDSLYYYRYGASYCITCTYAADGALLMKEYEAQDAVFYTIIYDYGADGNLLRKEVSNSAFQSGEWKDTHVFYAYTYDERGNLSQSIITSDAYDGCETVDYKYMLLSDALAE